MTSKFNSVGRLSACQDLANVRRCIYQNQRLLGCVFVIIFQEQKGAAAMRLDEFMETVSGLDGNTEILIGGTPIKIVLFAGGAIVIDSDASHYSLEGERREILWQSTDFQPEVMGL